MDHYSLLTVSTVVIIALAGLIWVKTRNVSFPLGIAFLYYWSLYGAWSVIVDKTGGDSGKSYQYLEQKLFRIHLDDNYYWALVLYAAFIIVVELTLLLLIRPIKARSEQGRVPVRVSHVSILAFAAVSGIVSYFIIRPDILNAMSSSVSAYRTTSYSGSRFYTLHQISDIVALFAAALGCAIFFSGKNPRLLGGRGSRWTGVGYLLVLAGVFSFNLVIGNRHPMVTAGVAGGLFYLANARRPRKMLLLAIGVITLSAVTLVGVLRGVPMSALEPQMVIRGLVSLPRTFRIVTSSIEAFAAHFSMPGLLKFDVPLTYGSSLVSLAASVVPRLLWWDRPPGIYSYYRDSVGGTPGQGYTIHHAAGWYLNFGVAGVVVGAAVLGWVWARCFNGYARAWTRRPLWRYIFAVLSPWMIVAYLPSLIRTGLEGYKGLIVEGLLIPTVILTFASYRWILFPQHPTQDHLNGNG